MFETIEHENAKLTSPIRQQRDWAGLMFMLKFYKLQVCDLAEFLARAKCRQIPRPDSHIDPINMEQLLKHQAMLSARWHLISIKANTLLSPIN